MTIRSYNTGYNFLRVIRGSRSIVHAIFAYVNYASCTTQKKKKKKKYINIVIHPTRENLLLYS